MIPIEHLARLTSKISAPFLDQTLKALSSNRKINNFLKRLEIKHLHKIDKPKRILIIPDINIGDAIITQSFISPLKYFFPDMEISYVYQSKAYPLIKANPYVDRHFPLFKNLGFPSKRDCKDLKNIIERYDFDLIINFCPYLSNHNFKSADSSVINPLRFIANIIRDYASDSRKAQIAFQMNKFAKELIDEFPFYIRPKTKPRIKFSENLLFTTQQLCKKTRKAMDKLNINTRAKKILFNPDTASPYTLIPLKFQLELIKGILSRKNVTLLLNCGFIFKGIEKKILNEIPPSLRNKIVVIPRDIPIDVYAALIDVSPSQILILQ
jgi:ADP-heptose:LPS heptosyltransferase